MSNNNMYYEVEESILDEIASEKKLFSFRALIKILTASSIAKKL
jgi:hypothetical protein